MVTEIACSFGNEMNGRRGMGLLFHRGVGGVEWPSKVEYCCILSQVSCGMNGVTALRGWQVVPLPSHRYRSRCKMRGAQRNLEGYLR